MMEQKFTDTKWATTEHEKFSQLQTAVKQKDKLINHLEGQIEEQVITNPIFIEILWQEILFAHQNSFELFYR